MRFERERQGVTCFGREDRASSVDERDTVSTISIEKDRASGVSAGRDGERSNVHVRKDLSRDLGSMSNIQGTSSVSVERDWETSNFISEDISGGLLSDISIVMEGSCSLGEGYRENDIVSWGSGEQGSLRDISNVMGRSGSLGKGYMGNIVSQGSEGNQHEILGDISNVMGRASALEEGYREIGN